MEPTGNPSEIRKLNELLGQELGRNPYGEPVFSWRWSEKCLWFATRTGRTTRTEKRSKVQIIGGGEEDIVIEEVVPEYKIDRQLGSLRDAWLICRWLTPWQLILGARGGDIRYGALEVQKPSDEDVEAAWKRQYPGSDFPSNGWRVPMGQTWVGGDCPGKPSDPPTMQDTRSFIRLLKAQVALTFGQGMAEWEDAQAQRDAETQKGIEDISRDAFPAALNPEPGKRGNFVSFPWSKFDRFR